MHILKTLKPVRMNGKIVEPGHVVKVGDTQGLIEKGYARQLTEEEAQNILYEYIKDAEELFSETPVKETMPKNKKIFGFSASNDQKEGDSPAQAANTGFAGYSGGDIETEKSDNITDPDFIPETDDPVTNGWEA